MAKNVIVKVKPAMAVMTPYALARMSRDMFGAGKHYKTDDKVPLIKYYLFCASIELGLKAAILATDCTSKRKKHLRSEIGHDLEKAVGECSKLYGLGFLKKSDLEVIRKINPYFKGKGLEYFTGEMMQAMGKGYKALPKVGELKATADKVQKFLKANKHFIDGKTSEKPNGGIINFV